MENDMRFAIFDRADLQNTYWKSNQVDCTSIDQTNFDFGVLRNNIFNLSTGAAKGLNTLTCVPADISAQEAFEHATHPDEVLLQQRAYAQNLLDTMAAEGNTSDAYKVLEPKLRELTQPANTNQNIPPAVDAFLRQLTTSGTMDEAVRAQAAVLLKSLAKPAASIPQEQPASTGRGSLKLTQVEVKNKTLYGRDFSGQNLSDIDFSGWHLGKTATLTMQQSRMRIFHMPQSSIPVSLLRIYERQSASHTIEKRRLDPLYTYTRQFW